MTRDISAIINLSTSNNLIISPNAPYNWNGGDHDIVVSTSNVPVIAMAYCHEGADVPAIDDDSLSAARIVINSATSTDTDITAANRTICMNQVSRDFAIYVNWYIVLVACMQVRELTDANIDNFGRMCGGRVMPSGIKKYLHYWSNVQVKFVESVAIREKFVNNKFFEYHTIGCSTPALCNSAISDTTFLNFFSEQDVNVVRTALADVTNVVAAKAIPNSIIVKTRAVLEASGTLPDVWYMGNQALSRFSGRKYAAMVKLLRSIFDKRSNTEGLSELDVDTLVTRLNALIE